MEYTEASSFSPDSEWVYVAAEDAVEAQGKALEAMREFEWRYDAWAGTVEVIATMGPYHGDVFIH